MQLVRLPKGEVSRAKESTLSARINFRWSAVVESGRAGVLKKRRNRPLTIIGSRERELYAAVLLLGRAKSLRNADSPSNKKINRRTRTARGP